MLDELPQNHDALNPEDAFIISFAAAARGQERLVILPVPAQDLSVARLHRLELFQAFCPREYTSICKYWEAATNLKLFP